MVSLIDEEIMFLLILSFIEKITSLFIRSFAMKKLPSFTHSFPDESHVPLHSPFRGLTNPNQE